MTKFDRRRICGPALFAARLATSRRTCGSSICCPALRPRRTPSRHKSRSRGSCQEAVHRRNPGTRNIDHLRGEPRGTRCRVDGGVSERIDADFSKPSVHGGRMNEMQMRAVERAGKGRDMLPESRFGFGGREARHDLREAGHDVVLSYARSQRKLNRLARQRRRVRRAPS